MGMGMNYWKWEGMGMKKIFPLISNYVSRYTLQIQQKFIWQGAVMSFLVPAPQLKYLFSQISYVYAHFHFVYEDRQNHDYDERNDEICS